MDSIFLIFLEILEILEPTLARSLRDPVDYGSQDKKQLPNPADFGLCSYKLSQDSGDLEAVQ